MAWIELHQSVPTHRKTLALADALSIEPVQAVGHLCCLWLWTLDNAPSGALLDVPSRSIARAAHWRKDPVVFVDALIQSGFLDADHHVHDWDDYTFRLLEGRDHNRLLARDRQRRWRDRNALATGSSNGLVTRDETANNGATVPNRTVPGATIKVAPSLTLSSETARAPNVALPRRAPAPGPKPDDEEPQALRPKADLCPSCRQVFTGSYDDHLRISAGHKIRPEPDNLTGPPRRNRRGQGDPIPSEVKAELAAMQQAKSERGPVALSDEIVAEHERLLKREREGT